jgi:hypothetical protein
MENTDDSEEHNVSKAYSSIYINLETEERMCSVKGQDDVHPRGGYY